MGLVPLRSFLFLRFIRAAITYQYRLLSQQYLLQLTRVRQNILVGAHITVRTMLIKRAFDNSIKV